MLLIPLGVGFRVHHEGQLGLSPYLADRVEERELRSLCFADFVKKTLLRKRNQQVEKVRALVSPDFQKTRGTQVSPNELAIQVEQRVSDA